MSLPLSGIKVIDFSNYVAAPSTGRLLVDMGAEVIKIEARGGDQWRYVSNTITRKGDDENPIFDVINAGKQSICLNIKDEKGMEILMRMLENADVFITNTRAKSLVKLGLDGKTLTEKFPRLVYAVLDGYGDKGPDADTPGFDGLAFWSRSGYLLDSPEASSAYPLNSGTSIGDTVTGLSLAAGIMAALFAREKTGRGDIVHTSLYGSAIWVMHAMILQAHPKYGKSFPMSRSVQNALTSVYTCKDGNWFKLGILDYNKDAHRLYALLGITEEVKAIGIVDAATKAQHNTELRELLEKAFLTRDRDEWVNLLREEDIVSGTVAHFSDVSFDEQAWANGYLEEVHFRNGETCPMPRTPIHFASAPLPSSPEGPLPGEQTDEILLSLGYSKEEILDLKTRGTV